MEKETKELEKKEEILHADLDNDKEAGESKDHVAKVEEPLSNEEEDDSWIEEFNKEHEDIYNEYQSLKAEKAEANYINMLKDNDINPKYANILRPHFNGADGKKFIAELKESNPEFFNSYSNGTVALGNKTEAQGVNLETKMPASSTESEDKLNKAGIA